MHPDYQTTSKAFDTVAPDYDAAYGPSGNALMSWLRQESLWLLKDTFSPGSRLLEIGCGTGDEALQLAQDDRTVLATDISAQMAARTRCKAHAAGLADRVTALALPAGHIDSLRPTVPFDGAYASFGALNCEPNLRGLTSGLARALRSDGRFVCSVIARWCPFEIGWYLLRGRPRTAFRRLRRGWQPALVAGTEGVSVTVPVRYLSVKEVASAFTPAFVVQRVLSLPLLLPPPYLDDLFQRQRNLFSRLEVWERRLRERWPWRYMGDHVVVVLRKL